MLAAISQVAKSVPRGETQILGLVRWISKPWAGAIAALEEFSDGQLTPKDLQDMLKQPGGAADVIETLQDLTQGDAVKLAKLFPDQEARAFMQSVKPDNIRQLTAEIEKYEGTVQRAFLEGSGNISRELAKLKVRIWDIAFAVGQLMAPKITALTDILDVGMERAVTYFENLDDNAKRLVSTLLLLGPVAIAVGAGLHGLAFALGPLIKFTPIVAKGIWGVGKAVFTLGPTLAGAKAAVLSFAAGAAIIMPPLWVVIAVIAALAAAALTVRRYWEPIKTFFKGFGEGLRSGFAPALAGLQPLLNAVGLLFRSVGGAIGVAWQWFRNLIGPIERTTSAIYKTYAQGKSFGELLSGAVGGALTGFASVIERIIGTLIHLGEVWSWVRSGFKGPNPFQGLADFDHLENVGESWLKQFQPPGAASTPVRPAPGQSPPGQSPQGQSPIANRPTWLPTWLQGGAGANAVANTTSLPNLIASGGAVPAGAGFGPSTTNFTLTIDRIDISVPSGDPQRIASGVADSLGDEVRRLAERYDSQELA